MHGDLPVIAAGANPNGPAKGVAGRINWPVSLAGTTVNPGDLIVGDADGVVVVPREAGVTTIRVKASDGLSSSTREFTLTVIVLPSGGR